ncbi:hypothetical protein [Limosilactobacillus reuteri]|uniref:hypothetical protein n=1 Tax=Limosilactobacillus reuteri TaxID=1598 RepID=UPI001E47E13D|nr:hypothetical protein [Limosilactobacillus reuteri]MCC4499955.1 hypothetical protein [Limosilactobacillus reuteri]MCC4504289.1 hypothetical protein [Limosilactobacillus reuteri]MCC4506543.1 hypothetical protein [Limosilactobacillus reuteri]
MQLVTLTAPDGHRERWDMKTTYLALLSWYSYLKDTENGKEPTELATRISKFVGDDIKQVHTFLVYLDGFNGDLYSKLSLLTNNDDKNTTRLYFIMKSLNNPNYLAHNKREERERQKIVKRIEQVTNNDARILRRLIALTKLFVDGQLSYKNMEVCK